MAARKNPAASEYTLEQIGQHTRPDDVWVAIHGKVYDVSGYLDDHPGGKDVLLELAGSDATIDFDFVGHSDDAMKALTAFEVGSLAGHAVRANRTTRKQVSETEADKEQKSLLREVVRWRPRPWALFIPVGAGLTLIPAARDAILSHDLFDGIHLVDLGSFQSGILATLVGLSIVGSVAVAWIRRSLFHYQGAFEYAPYYSI